MFRHYFRSSKAHFWLYFQLQRSTNDLINPDFQSKFDPLLTFERVVFSHFGDRKSCIFDFFKVVWKLFLNCLGILFGLERPTFDCIFSSKGLYLTLKIEIFSQNISHFDRFEGSFLAILGFKKVVSGLFESCFRFA